MKKLSLYAFLTLGLAFSSCSVVSISDNEDKGVKEILGYYGGACKYSIGYSASSAEGKKKYFEVEMSKSDLLEEYVTLPEMAASNIAYLFYHNLQQEKNKYDEVRVAITFQNGKEVKFTYPKEDLAVVTEKMSVVDKVVAIIKSRKFEDLKPLLHPDTVYVDYNKDTLINRVARLDPQFGTIKEFVPGGFRLIKRKRDHRELLHISGMMMRDKQNNQFSVDIDPKATKEEIIVLEYKL